MGMDHLGPKVPHDLSQSRRQLQSVQSRLIEDCDRHLLLAQLACELAVVHENDLWLDIGSTTKLLEQIEKLHLGAGPEISGDDMQHTQGNLAMRQEPFRHLKCDALNARAENTSREWSGRQFHKWSTGSFAG